MDLADDFLAWWTGNESTFDPKQQLASGVVANAFLTPVLRGVDEVASWVAMHGATNEVTIFRRTATEDRACFVYSGVDSVTGLGHWHAMTITMHQGQIKDVVSVHSQGVPPEALQPAPPALT